MFSCSVMKNAQNMKYGVFPLIEEELMLLLCAMQSLLIYNDPMH